MYDTEEEIKEKRKKLFIIIGVVAFIILLLIIFIIVKSSGKSKKKSNENVVGQISCELEVLDNVQSQNGVYNQEIEIGFKNITLISKDYQLIKKTVGTVDNSRNKETYKISKSGKFTVHGYIQDSSGNKGKCDLEVVVNMSKPTCELEVIEGVLGNNEWYRSDVVVGFKNMDVNNNSLTISKYYIEESLVDIDTEEAVRSEIPKDNIEKITVTENQVTNLVGYVIDSNGSEGTCDITIKKDSTIPTCSLKVVSGSTNANGEYTDNPVIEFENYEDTVSIIEEKGIGISKNYESESYQVTNEGSTTVVGYVKDEAGNEGSCSIEIKKPGSSGGQVINKESNPTCKISFNKKADNNKFSSAVTLNLTYNTTNGAQITSYGLGPTSTYNNQKQIEIKNEGTHTIYGIVKDSYGNVGKCQSSSFSISYGEPLANKVKIGDYVNYQAGTWSETKTENKTDGYVWGYKSGTTKETGVKCSTSDLGTRNGWIVLSISNSKVTLVHAGTPECIYHSRVDGGNLISIMNSETQKFINSKYAESAYALSCSNVDCNKQTINDNVIVTKTRYYLATKTNSNNTSYSVSAKGKIENTNNISLGMRPVVVLKSSVLTTGKENGVWMLK